MSREAQNLVRLLQKVFRLTGGRMPMSLTIVICIGVVLYAALIQPALDSKEGFEPPPVISKERAPEQPASRTDSSSPHAVLKSIGAKRFLSPAGLVYGPGSTHGHRFDHVMAHAEDEPDRIGQHGVFDPGDAASVIAAIDEAYEKALLGRDSDVEHDGKRSIYTVNLRRRIGFIGGQSGARKNNPIARHIKLVVEGERLITAFPIIP